MFKDFLKYNKLLITYNLLTKNELNNLIKDIECLIDINSFYKNITLETDNNNKLYCEIKNIIHSKKEIIFTYSFIKDDFIISFNQKMCIIEHTNKENIKYFQDIVKLIFEYILKSDYISPQTIYLENYNVVLFKDEKTLKENTNEFSNIPKNFDDLHLSSNKDMYNFIHAENIKNLSNASINNKNYLYLEFINKIQIDFYILLMHPNEEQIKMHLKELETFDELIKESFKETFNNINRKNIEKYYSFSIIGGI